MAKTKTKTKTTFSLSQLHTEETVAQTNSSIPQTSSAAAAQREERFANNNRFHYRNKESSRETQGDSFETAFGRSTSAWKPTRNTQSEEGSEESSWRTSSVPVEKKNDSSFEKDNNDDINWRAGPRQEFQKKEENLNRTTPSTNWLRQGNSIGENDETTTSWRSSNTPPLATTTTTSRSSKWRGMNGSVPPSFSRSEMKAELPSHPLLKQIAINEDKIRDLRSTVTCPKEISAIPKGAREALTGFEQHLLNTFLLTNPTSSPDKLFGKIQKNLEKLLPTVGPICSVLRAIVVSILYSEKGNQHILTLKDITDKFNKFSELFHQLRMEINYSDLIVNTCLIYVVCREIELIKNYPSINGEITLLECIFYSMWTNIEFFQKGSIEAFEEWLKKGCSRITFNHTKAFCTMLGEDSEE